MTTEYGSGVKVTQEGAVYVCGVCKKEITVVVEDNQSYPYHLGECLRISCRHCLDMSFISGIHKCSNPKCACKDTSNIYTVASTLMLFNQEYTLLDDMEIINLRNKIFASKQIVAILMKQLNKTVSLYKTNNLLRKELYADYQHANTEGEIKHDYATIEYHENKIKNNEKLLECLEKRTIFIKKGCIDYIVGQYTKPPVFTKIDASDTPQTDVVIEEGDTMMFANTITEDIDKKTNTIHARKIRSDTPGWVLDVCGYD